MSNLSSFIGRRSGRSSLNETELEAMRRAAWLKQGVVMVRPEELGSPMLEMALEAHAISRWGRRRGDRS